MVELIFIFILVYLVSFAINLIDCYIEYKYCINTVGDLIDRIEFHMWFPILNTFSVIGLFLVLCSIKLEILWEKFRNIKLK
jgi:hypothetical protein